MARVTISESVLRWALERSGNYEGVFKKFQKLPDWLDGKSQPTLHQLESLAQSTLTPLGYFFLAEPPIDQLPIPLFRTSNGKASSPSPNLLETVNTMQRRQTWMRDFLVEEGSEPLDFVRSATPQDAPEDVALRIKDSLGIEDGWATRQPNWTIALRELFRKVEEARILIVINSVVANNTHRKLDPREFRGFVLVDEYAPLVFLNGADSKAAQMFTIAHELAHLWYGNSAAFDLRDFQPAQDEVEKACDRVAAEFLVPAAELRALWPSIARRADPYQAAALNFKVSEIVAARRARDLRLITGRDFFEFYEAYQVSEKRRFKKGKGGGDFYATQNLRVGRRFAETVILATLKGRLLYGDAFQLTGLHGKAFDSYAASLGFGGAA